MTRASDLTYLFRAVFTTWTFLWFLQHVWNIDRFEALRWRRVKRFELKSAITILLCIMCPLLATYDIATSKIKYTEGFMVIPFNGEIITKPVQFWSDDNRRLVMPINYILCASFSAQTCLLFLLQSFWNYLANNIAKTTFMGSFEFKSYIIYSVFSMALFPLLQWLFRYDDVYTEVVPQLAYGVMMFIIGLLGVRSHWRFTRLLRITRIFVTLILIFYPSSNTLNDTLMMAKSVASSYNAPSKGNLLEPPSRRWSRFNQNNENSSWSSQGSSRNDRASWYLDVNDDPSVAARNNLNKSRPTSVSFDIPPLPTSVTLNNLPPNSPPSIYKPSATRETRNSSSFYFTSNALLPSPIHPSSTPLPAQQQPTNLPSSAITSDHTNNSNNSRSLNSSKPSTTETLKYPSSPLSKINRNSLASLASLEDQMFTGNSSTPPHDHHHDISPLIPSQLTRKGSNNSLNSEKDFVYISRKNARMSTISNRDRPIIKVTTSTSSFKISSNLTDDEYSDIDEYLPTNSKVTKSGKFVKKKKVTLMDGNQKASVRFQQRQEELLKQKQKSLALMIGDNGNDDIRMSQQYPYIVTQVNELENKDNNDSSQKLSRVPSSPTLERFALDCTNVTPLNKVTPRSSSLRFKAYNNLKTDVVEMERLDSPTSSSSNSSPKSSSTASPITPISTTPISPTSTLAASISPTSPLSTNSLSQSSTVPNFKSAPFSIMPKGKPGILMNYKDINYDQNNKF
ncbi:10805_t:CDS:2 [Cetraspora pellucida]|uniref:10805_t:CDS:1 n=1 Tax=Cetraspora pellucida TaxID=1433469 RepID=A0A9N9E4N0_9GLOM|nr:10805_t:CDS:2 [Cetraspora pellucida]